MHTVRIGLAPGTLNVFFPPYALIGRIRPNIYEKPVGADVPAGSL